MEAVKPSRAAYHRARYHENLEESRANGSERFRTYFEKNKDIVRARNLARYYLKKGQKEYAIHLMQEAGLDIPGSWNKSPVSTVEESP